ncbi:MAG: hypothetical protein HY589_00235 [Candidatus Omnitrophica bacterium]|nr:hypothetical protein [Candidatus Omnitrophota bacterium]
MKKLITITVLAGLFLLPAYIAQAGNTPTGLVTVKVKITAALSINIEDSTKLVDLAEITAGSTKVSARGILVRNDGSGVKETYSLSLGNPAGWTASQTAAGFNTYILNAAFASAADKVTWDNAKHALSTSSVASSDTKFAGDQTGRDVPYNETRTIWFQFVAPGATDVDAAQEIPVTITAG